MPKRKRGFYSVGEIDASPQLATELLSYGNECVDIDQQIQILREQKADLFERMRDASFDPAHARAWSAEKLKDEEKEALKREKRTEAELIVETLAATETAKGRAGARARNAAKVGSQDNFDPATGEITETDEVRAFAGLANAETSSSEALCEHGAGAPMHPQDPAPQSDQVLYADGSVFGGPHDAPRSASAPYRIEPRTPAPAPDWPEMPAGLDRSRQAVEQEAAE